MHINASETISQGIKCRRSGEVSEDVTPAVKAFSLLLNLKRRKFHSPPPRKELRHPRGEPPSPCLPVNGITQGNLFLSPSPQASRFAPARGRKLGSVHHGSSAAWQLPQATFSKGFKHLLMQIGAERDLQKSHGRLGAELLLKPRGVRHLICLGFVENI